MNQAKDEVQAGLRRLQRAWRMAQEGDFVAAADEAAEASEAFKRAELQMQAEAEGVIVMKQGIKI